MTSENPHSELLVPSRRQLLAGAAAVAGAGLVGSCQSAGGHNLAALASSAAKPRVPLGEGETIRIGVIGTGGMGRSHCQAITNLANEGREKVHIVATANVCETHLEQGHKICTENQENVEVTKYRYYEELLEREDIHGVLIASPEHWHAKMAIDAILSGKDVYVEKPMTLDLHDAKALHAVATSHDAVVQVGTQKMQLPKYNAAKRLIAEGAIGKPVWSQTSYCRNSKDGEWLYYGIDDKVQPGEVLDWEAWCGPLGLQTWDTNVFHRWRRYKKYSTGIIGDLLVHEMTPLMYAVDAGWPTRVDGIGGHYVDKAMENFDQVNLTVQFEGEHTMIIAGSTCNEQGLTTTVRGHEATMLLGGSKCQITPERLFAEELEEHEEQFEGLHDQDEHRLNWLSCIRTREQPKGDVTTATKVMVVVDLAARSMWEGKAFTFDPASLTAAQA
jgi:predicted dehydrogenase